VAAHHDAEIATLLFEHARDVLFVLDADSGQIIDANRAAETAYGYSRSELLALTIFQIRAADPEPVSRQMRLADTEGFLFRTIHQRNDGSTFDVEVNSRGHTIGGRRVLLSVIRDISERCRLEAEREALIETTRRALELRDEFLVTVSHELRSPVTNISLQLQQLARLLDRGHTGPHLGDATHRALEEVARLSHLITALLDAQQATGPIALARGPVDLELLVEDVVARLRSRAELSSSSVSVDVPSIRGDWDRLRLEQVFTNLIVNAIKYGRGRPIEIFATVDDDTVQVDIRDHGIGISPSDASRIFEKFERAVPAAYGGLGLGLYITRQLIVAHGGSISFDSALGEGTTFHVRLPIRE
jgi:PAS domain S-box-containing protein